MHAVCRCSTFTDGEINTWVRSLCNLFIISDMFHTCVIWWYMYIKLTITTGTQPKRTCHFKHANTELAVADKTELKY